MLLSMHPPNIKFKFSELQAIDKQGSPVEILAPEIKEGVSSGF